MTKEILRVFTRHWNMFTVKYVVPKDESDLKRLKTKFNRLINLGKKSKGLIDNERSVTNLVNSFNYESVELEGYVREIVYDVDMKEVSNCIKYKIKN